MQAPTLFAIFYSMMLREAMEELTEGIYIRFRADGSVFNLRRLPPRPNQGDREADP